MLPGGRHFASCRPLRLPFFKEAAYIAWSDLGRCLKLTSLRDDHAAIRVQNGQIWDASL
jgi:hypothetical protein